jgi:endo-1,4-beta-D-glucanase Y
MQSDTRANGRILVGRRTMLATLGGGAATLALGGGAAIWAGNAWGMVDPAKTGGGRNLADLFALPEPLKPAPPPLPPRRVTHPAAVTPEGLAEWDMFKRRFVAGEGRVVDTGNGGVSHTEGQGWGMLCAVAFDDPATFDLLYGWTARTLRRRADRLHSWRYMPNAQIPVADPNNATDGDLFIASALWRAAWRWGRPDLEHAAQAIARDVLSLLVRQVGDRTVLLPGANGFETQGLVTINPSYYVFPALEEMAALAPSPVWARLMSDGAAMLSEGRFGRWQLPPDWLRLDRQTGALAPHPNWPARFSYDAIRVPLWLAWSGQPSSAVAESFGAYWSLYQPAPPAWIDLNTNAQARYPAPPGVVAIGHTATALSQPGRKGVGSIQFPPIRSSPDYYSAALTMLSRCAWQECWDM